MSEEESDVPTMNIGTLSLMNIKDNVNLEMHKHGQVLDAIELTLVYIWCNRETSHSRNEEPKK